MCIATWNSAKAATIADAVLLRAWRRTVYTAGPVAARIGRRDDALDRILAELGVREGGFVTAWNPMSRRMPAGWNRRMIRSLHEYARRIPQIAGRGIGDDWWEEHLLLGADPRRVVVLARRFRQRGVVIVGVRQAPRLVVLDYRSAIGNGAIGRARPRRTPA